MRSHEVCLQLFELLDWDVDLCELPKTGVDSVCRLASGDNLVDCFRAGPDTRSAAFIQLDRLKSFCNQSELGKAQLSGGEGEHAGLIRLWRED